ncbi:Na+/H+ antiporter NhaA [Tenacibaculum sp. 1_MG-2023]|uniref:Na+/H+ antiporter NhaA n=1 Tax=Tenacibaculum sp. 1_MG-2023 TaxID=3062653 RepID=UPI0026E218CE|nr:Na+/H+ antiporter NhaA [Tenacibaculum sp. 1_MG-2023]MDO6675571.1 Na+/H+ antiporter NhaA [Tenacibaculum sp. 1_MG-2023]
MNKKRIISPFKKFLKTESASGILLLVATLIALIWANSPFRDSYSALWEYKIGFKSEHLELYKPLILWINDGLMAVFFFLIGLEIKREFLIGELNTTKKLAFPLFGAVGGMLFPVLFFILLNEDPETAHGWGVPMATDIAFSLAVLNTLGKRVPLSLKIFLTAFAIVDDIGAVLVIALFYSASIDITLISIAIALLAFLYFIAHRGFYSHYITFMFGAVIWVLFLKAGIHPTVAGILMAFAVPIRQKAHTTEFLANLSQIMDNIKKAKTLPTPILSKEQIDEIDNLDHWIEDYQSPLQLLEHKLHGIVAYAIIPIFALANAGVSILDSDAHLDSSLIIHIALCLVLGNSIGITTIITTVKKLKIIEVPKDINTRHIIGVSFLAGIGFTMAIFIASLAFAKSPEFLGSAKIGVLLGSLVSAIIGYLILRYNKTDNTIIEKEELSTS